MAAVQNGISETEIPKYVRSRFGKSACNAAADFLISCKQKFTISIKEIIIPILPV